MAEEAATEFWRALLKAEKCFPRHGQFTLGPDQSVNAAVRENDIPNEYGFYLIFGGLNRSGPLLYVGKAGTIRCDGSLKAQGLQRRLMMKQDGVYRESFFRALIVSERLPGLTINWFVTWSERQKILPALAEAEILQAYFDQYGHLPKLNKCI